VFFPLLPRSIAEGRRGFGLHEVGLDDDIHGTGVDEGQARTNTFAEIAPCPRSQAESDAVPLVRQC
jgi:hypothetical protein